MLVGEDSGNQVRVFQEGRVHQAQTHPGVKDDSDGIFGSGN